MVLVAEVDIICFIDSYVEQDLESLLCNASKQAADCTSMSNVLCRQRNISKEANNMNRKLKIEEFFSHIIQSREHSV